MHGLDQNKKPSQIANHTSLQTLDKATCSYARFHLKPMGHAVKVQNVEMHLA